MDPELAEEPATERGAAFWIGAVLGTAIIAFAVHGLLAEERAGAPSAARWLVGAALAIDLLIVPAAAAVGWLARRAVPSCAWPAVRAGLLASAVLVAFALPLVADLGGAPDNPTVRPRPYPTGLAQALAAVWIAAATWGLAAWWRRGRAPARGSETWQHAADADRGGRPGR